MANLILHGSSAPQKDSGVSDCPTARRSQGVSQSPTTILLPASQGLEQE
ncbi:MAG: hypothetical protein F6K26_33325 [Moorea sp. SIO2I5]|nr:hypothetical protein [Moorena sp. SIO2I5]